jgi:hypothetical protein
MRGLRLLLLPCPTERRFKYLRSDAQSTSLFDNRRVYRQCRTVDLNAVLREDDGLARVRGKTTRDDTSRSIWGIGGHPRHDPLFSFVQVEPCGEVP